MRSQGRSEKGKGTYQSSMKWSLVLPQLAQASTTLRLGGFGPDVS